MQAYDPMENDMNHLLRKRKAQEPDDDLETGMSDNGRQLQSFEDNKRLRRDGREMQQGGGRWLMGLPHEKMILIKEKKEEIEKVSWCDRIEQLPVDFLYMNVFIPSFYIFLFLKALNCLNSYGLFYFCLQAYRQDCETFATVTKLLIRFVHF